MMPIPAEVVARWSPMWPAGHHPGRPWWRPDFARTNTHILLPAWRRCDGAFGPWVGDDGIANCLAERDAEHPIPAPPLMPGQVWIVDGAEFTVQSRAAHGRFCLVHTADLRVEDGIVVWYEDDPRAGFLVAGPTPWGRDAPWAPVAVTQ